MTWGCHLPNESWAMHRANYGTAAFISPPSSLNSPLLNPILFRLHFPWHGILLSNSNIQIQSQAVQLYSILPHRNTLPLSSHFTWHDKIVPIVIAGTLRLPKRTHSRHLAVPCLVLCRIIPFLLSTRHILLSLYGRLRTLPSASKCFYEVQDGLYGPLSVIFYRIILVSYWEEIECWEGINVHLRMVDFILRSIHPHHLDALDGCCLGQLVEYGLEWLAEGTPANNR